MVFGVFRPSAFHGASKMWQPMSPDQPVPKSSHVRYFIG
jgi:hypothetical protein